MASHRLGRVRVTAGGSGGGAPTGSAGGSLTGTYPNPTIATIPSGATATTQTAADGSTKVATTAYVDTADALKAPLASPTLTGTPAAPTAAVDTNTTQVATTAYVVGQGYAKLASPTLTGTPAAPSAAQGTNTTQIATTAMVHSEAVLLAPIASPTFTGTVTLPHNGTVAVSDLASGIPQSLSSSGSSTKAVADTSAHVIGGAPFWNGTGWLGLGMSDYYMNGSNANISETVPRRLAGIGAVVIGATGIMTSTAVVLYAGQIITNITFRTASTAANGPTHWWVALYDTQATPALVAQSSDQLTAAVAGTTNFTVALGSPAPYTVTTTGVHYLSVMFATSSAQPTLLGLTVPNNTTNAAVVSGQKVAYQSSGSALTGTAPGTIASGTALAGFPYLATS